MTRKILVTGSSGLVGTAVTAALRVRGIETVPFDIRAAGEAHRDVRNPNQVRQVIPRIDGVVHLAAVSRVIWGEQDPEGCWETNVGGLQNVLDGITEAGHRPWMIFASSREVYGQPSRLPATEGSPKAPVNVYGRAKVRGEELIENARTAGLRACTVRLSNVFGSNTDHADRVVPAFARAAAMGETLRVDGADQTFDFTHVEDVTRGITTLAEMLADGETPPPPIHLVTGRPTTLGELAELAIRLGRSGSSIRYAPPRDFDVAQFFGAPDRARSLLGWRPSVSVEEGMTRLIHAFEFDQAEEVEP
ncbi:MULTISPECIES: NAD(P)-dependent oxidoreductase [unclassified Thioalkalivibrio]|uniref:NAD-dependent epimerase/dehydratase family protein n=1 Tax=unclassified Thioalkalivibrio TaxID=2621013 RepID=UPI00036537F4|nr:MULTISPECIES: NAD(P)-dependent oxidoreductase [unclassified Thioalkalivibrio]